MRPPRAAAPPAASLAEMPEKEREKKHKKIERGWGGA
jgi:hypothetical protein